MGGGRRQLVLLCGLLQHVWMPGPTCSLPADFFLCASCGLESVVSLRMRLTSCITWLGVLESRWLSEFSKLNVCSSSNLCSHKEQVSCRKALSFRVELGSGQRARRLLGDAELLVKGIG